MILSKTYIQLGAVHKLRLQYLAFFDHQPPSVYIFYGINLYKKSLMNGSLDSSYLSSSQIGINQVIHQLAAQSLNKWSGP